MGEYAFECVIYPVQTKDFKKSNNLKYYKKSIPPGQLFVGAIF